jgi:hypothetical protein
LHFGRKGGGRNGSSCIDLIKEYIYWRDSISRPAEETKSESQKLKKEKKTFLRTNSNTKDFLCHDNSRGQFVEHNGYVGPICRTQWISGRISSYDTLLAPANSSGCNGTRFQHIQRHKVTEIHSPSQNLKLAE